MILVVIALLLRLQRTWMGRLSGVVTLASASLHFLLIDVWLTIPLLYSHPHVLSSFSPMEGPLATLSLLGGIGLVVSTVRSRELEGWSSPSLHWLRWSLIGGSAGILVTLFVTVFLRPHLEPGVFLRSVAAFTALSTWAYFAGMALGLLGSALRAKPSQTATAA
jgi:hypothetical protein